MNRAQHRILYLLAAASFAASGCVTDGSAQRTDADYGKVLFLAHCADCHGTDASGSGVASLGLGTPPPSLRQLSKRNSGVFPREYVMSVIDGLARREHPGSVMPEFGAGDLGELVQVENDEGLSTPIPANLLAFANYLESIQE